MTTTYVQTANDKAIFNSVYRRGLADERLVIQHLMATGRTVTESTKDENIFSDIDCYVNGVPVSIKAQHSAARYGTIGLELSQHLTTGEACATSSSILANKELTFNDVSRLEATGNWQPSWFINGKAEVYCILIGEVMRTYTKKDIQNYLDTSGYVRMRALRADTKKTQGGKYRYCNAVSVYLPTLKVPHSKPEMVLRSQYN